LKQMRPHRKARLARLLPKPRQGIALNEYFAGDGDIVYRQACRLGCEGIVSKRLGSPYRSGRSKQWVKVKNPAAPEVRREAEEECRRVRRGPIDRPHGRSQHRQLPRAAAGASQRR
jgi:ATP-dependent DNA ligase